MEQPGNARSAHTPRTPKAIYRQVGRWADRAAHAILTGNHAEAEIAREKLHEHVTIATERLGMPDRFGPVDNPTSIIEDCTSDMLRHMTRTQLFDRIGKGLANDPLADIVLTRELIRRGELSEAAEEEEDLYLPLTGDRIETVKNTINPGDTPWKGTRSYTRAGRNGYPATYKEILAEYSAGAAACDNNHPLDHSPHRKNRHHNPEKADFLHGVWQAGWRTRRSQILTAQINAGLGEKFAGLGHA